MLKMPVFMTLNKNQKKLQQTLSNQNHTKDNNIKEIQVKKIFLIELALIILRKELDHNSKIRLNKKEISNKTLYGATKLKRL